MFSERYQIDSISPINSIDSIKMPYFLPLFKNSSIEKGLKILARTIVFEYNLDEEENLQNDFRITFISSLTTYIVLGQVNNSEIFIDRISYFLNKKT